MINLGDKVKDSISGFSGTVIAITDWLNGCRRITIAPNKLHNGAPIEPQTFDEQQIKLVKPKAPKPKMRKTGGDPNHKAEMPPPPPRW